jgi:DNA-directed RNA polymerase subunit alpha
MLIIQRPTVEALGEPENNVQRFAVGPLDPGFGHTLGNSLRRTLLSSIPGAAVTQVRFEEALHEFATIEGVKEDVTDIILNLKDLLLTVHSDEPVTLHFDKKGPGVATGADLQVTADVKVYILFCMHRQVLAHDVEVVENNYSSSLNYSDG